MAYGETDPAPVHPRLRGRRDADRAGRAGDAEALEPGPDRGRRAPGQDRAGADRVQRRVVVALTVVRAEGDQLEVPVLQRRGRAEQLRDLVDQLLVVAPVFGSTSFGHSPAVRGPSYICLRSAARMRDSCRWPTIGGILRFTVVLRAVPDRSAPASVMPVLWRCPVLGPVILAASRSDRMRRLVSAAPVTKQVVDRFIPGETVDEIVPIVQDLTDRGLEVTMDVVGEDITDPRAGRRRPGRLPGADRRGSKALDLGAGPRCR